jgi:hypothetical protein
MFWIPYHLTLTKKISPLEEGERREKQEQREKQEEQEEQEKLKQRESGLLGWEGR